jgi:NitT/TauT family transport system ATP-binding protein
MGEEYLIRLKDLSKSYNSEEKSARPGKKTAPVFIFDSINLNIREGEFHVFLGWSGCGKSILLNIIAGFVQKTSGQVIVDGKEVEKPGFERGVVFQNADTALFPWITVRKNIEYALKYGRSPSRSGKKLSAVV